MLQVPLIQAASRPSLNRLQRALWSIQAMMVLVVAPSLAQEVEPVLSAPRLTGLRSEGRNVVITWEGGAGPYQLYTRSTLSSDWVEVDAPTDGTSLMAVKTEQMAFFRVSSGRGNSTDRKAPSTPAGLRASALTCNEVSLSWSSASDTGTGVKGYMVYRDGVFLKTVLAPDTSTTDTSTDGNTSYSYSVRSYDFANNLSGLSAPITVTTPQCEDMIPPSTPLNVVATAVTSNQVDLRWQASSDTGGSGLAGYLVYAGTAYIGGSSTASYSARALAAGQEHCFTVIAYDGNGNSSAPSVVSCARTATGGGPANDSFAARLNLIAVPVDANNFGATKEAGEPQHAGNAGGKSVWFTWTAPASQYEVAITTTGSSFDTLLAVYKGSSVSTLTPVVSNDNDPNGGVSSAVRFYAEAGVTYAIAVDGKDGAAGAIRLNVASCSMVVFPLDAAFGATGGNGLIFVGSVSGCNWMAVSLADWLTVTSGNFGNGSGNVGYTVAPNPSALGRIGYIIVEGNIFLVSQEGAPCGNTLSHYSASFGAAAGQGAVGVYTSAPDCAWNAVSDVSWLTITSGASGSGSREVTFQVTANTGVGSRTGTLTIAGHKFTVTQAGAACSYSLSSNGASFPYAGGSSSVNILAQPGCNWSVTSDREWLVVTSGAGGNGNGAVSFTVAANNTTVERSGALTIGGLTFRVTQAAGPCSFAVSPLTTNVAAAAGAATVSVAAGAGCNWTAASQSPWISVTAGASGAANGSVTLTFGANPNSAARTGSLLIAGKAVSVTQAGTPCSYTLSSTSNAFTAAAGSGSFNVTAGIDCNWSAVPNAGWITIDSGVSAVGGGTVRYSVSANSSATPRTGSISVSGRTHYISQAGVGCSYAFSAPTASVPAGGGAGSVNLLAPSGCAWTAVTNSPWLTITSGRTGDGNNTINYSAAPNTTSAARSATIVVNGQTHTVNQPAETTAPPTPTGVSALAATCSDVNVAWFAVTDQGGSGLRAYHVYRNGVFVREVLAPTASFTDSGLAGSTPYSYAVEAIDNAGNRSQRSSAASVTTPACPPPPQDWARSFGSSNGDNCQVLTVDGSGNIVAGGWFSGAVDFGGGPLNSTTTYALYLAKYRPDGGYIWAKRFTSSAAGLSVGGVAVDANQNIFVAGSFQGTIDLGGNSLTSRGLQDVFVAKFDSTGRHLWSYSYGGSKADILEALSLDRAGNVVVVGFFGESGHFGGNYLGAPYSGRHGFVAKYDPNGGHVWSKDFPANADHSFQGVTTDSGNNVILTGYFQASIDFGGGFLNVVGVGANVFLTKLSPAGAHVWSQSFGGTTGSEGVAVGVDSLDNILLTGVFSYSASFGGASLAGRGIDVFVAKYTPAGAHVWSRAGGSLSDEKVYDITVDRAQNVIVTGWYRAPANFGGQQLSMLGETDIFIVKYNANGEHVWSERAGDNAGDIGASVTTDASNNVIVGGSFWGSMTIGSRTLTSHGGSDAFIYRRAP